MARAALPVIPGVANVRAFLASVEGRTDACECDVGHHGRCGARRGAASPKDGRRIVLKPGVPDGLNEGDPGGWRLLCPECLKRCTVPR